MLAGGVPEVIRGALTTLGALTETITVGADRAGAEDSAVEWTRLREQPHALVYDARPAFANGQEQGLQDALESGWAAIQEVASGGLLTDERPGKVVLLGPRADAGPFAEAARSALENLARTLSVEWARHRVTVTMIAPGPATTDLELADLICFLASPAGDYFSGCRFSLGTVDTRAGE